MPVRDLLVLMARIQQAPLGKVVAHQVQANRHAVEQMRSIGFRGFIAALARHADEAADLETAGADLAIDIYAEAGAGFAAEISRRLESAPGS